MSKKRILIISQNFYPEIGSAGNRIKNIYQLLKSMYEVDVLTTEASYPNKKLYVDEDFWYDQKLNEDEHIYRVKITNRKYTKSMFNRLLYYVEMMMRMIWMILFSKNKYDTVFVTSPPIFLGLVGILAKLRFKAKLILDVRDLWPDSLKGVGVFNYKWVIGFFKIIEKYMYNQADSIVINSKGFYNPILQLLKKDTPIEFIPNSIREKELVLEQQKNEDFTVVYSGNIGLAQDVNFLKDLSKALYENGITLKVIGFGLKRGELQDFVKEHKLKNVHFIKAMTRQQCLKLIKQSHVGVLGLKDEDVFDTVLPGKMIDYIACGLPIVAGVSGYTKSIIEDKRIGYVSETRDVNEIVKYVMYLKDNMDIVNDIVQKNKAIINKDFLWESNINILINAIEEQMSTQEMQHIIPRKDKKMININSKVH